jgi:hypothetical protein
VLVPQLAASPAVAAFLEPNAFENGTERRSRER